MGLQSKTPRVTTVGFITQLLCATVALASAPQGRILTDEAYSASSDSERQSYEQWAREKSARDRECHEQAVESLEQEKDWLVESQVRISNVEKEIDNARRQRDDLINLMVEESPEDSGKGER